MATSSTFNTTNQYIKYRIETTINSQNLANNTSNVTVKVFVWRANTGYTTYGAGTCYCTINGTSYNQAITTSHKITSSGIYLFSKTLDIKHNDDGKKTLSTSAYIEHATFSSSSNSANFTLTTIPRTSSVTCNSFFIGDSTTININRASSGFTHTIKYTYGPLTGTIATKTTATSVGWTAPKEDFYSQIPNGTTGYGSITCETYSGNTLIGTATTNFNAYAKQNECVPSVSATIVDTNEDIKKLTGNSSILVKYLSKPKVTISASSKYSSTIKSRKALWGDGVTSTSTETTFSDGVTSNNVTISATDSRGYTTSVNYNLTSSNKWIEYVKLAFSRIKLSREESTLSTAKINVSGNYFNGSFGSVKNSFTLKYRYKPKESGSTYTAYKTVTPTVTNDTFDYSEVLANIDSKKEYIFDFVLEDEAMIVYSGEQLLESGEAVFRIGEDYTRTNGRLLDRFGVELRNGLSKYESGGTTDVNTTIEELVLSSKNTPTTDFWYVKTMFYGAKTATSNRTQVAYPYNKKLPTYSRYYVNGTGWSEWFASDISYFEVQDTSGVVHFGNGYLVQWGRVSITPTAANTITSATVTFPRSYDYVPKVSALPNVSVPNAMTSSIGGGSTTDASKKSMMIYMTRINTVATVFQWEAKGWKKVV